jgi:hypothetical protein
MGVEGWGSASGWLNMLDTSDVKESIDGRLYREKKKNNIAGG